MYYGDYSQIFGCICAKQVVIADAGFFRCPQGRGQTHPHPSALQRYKVPAVGQKPLQLGKKTLLSTQFLILGRWGHSIKR